MTIPPRPCPYCGKLMWVKDETIEWIDENTVRFPCPHCRALVRCKMVDLGATAAGPIKPG
jgi:endogenous inhibitor of DNA gyrase (YacG/DUF329 family)